MLDCYSNNKTIHLDLPVNLALGNFVVFYCVYPVWELGTRTDRCTRTLEYFHFLLKATKRGQDSLRFKTY